MSDLIAYVFTAAVLTPAGFALTRHLTQKCLGFHSFTMWGAHKSIEVAAFGPDDATIIGTRRAIVQERACTSCGLVRHRRVRIP